MEPSRALDPRYAGMEIVKPSNDTKGFVVLLCRWVVEHLDRTKPASRRGFQKPLPKPWPGSLPWPPSSSPNRRLARA
jgi:hypothetical protein